MNYKVIRNNFYDFKGQSYGSLYPNLHKYPATMLPIIGIEVLKEFNVKSGKLLDPYCGTGSTFIAGLDNGLNKMDGFDINPLAVLIARTKFTKLDLTRINILKQRLRNAIFEFVKVEKNFLSLSCPEIYNKHFWFSENTIRNLSVIKYFIYKIRDKETRRMFLVPFSETIRLCSNTRNDEFKLYRMKPEDLLIFNPDVFGVYFDKLNKAIEIYEKYYYPKLDSSNINVDLKKFQLKSNYYDVVLTSPPYGDSRTTVAYGEFSTFSNEWLGFKNARNIDKLLMGGKPSNILYDDGTITESIKKVSEVSNERALQVSAFYSDLENSINDVAKSVKKGGKSIYIVGNRRVKDVELLTDQFIADKFEKFGFKHLLTYKRLLTNKAMPAKNSPSNIKGVKKSTMKYEYIVVSEKYK